MGLDILTDGIDSMITKIFRDFCIEQKKALRDYEIVMKTSVHGISKDDKANYKIKVLEKYKQHNSQEKLKILDETIHLINSSGDIIKLAANLIDVQKVCADKIKLNLSALHLELVEPSAGISSKSEKLYNEYKKLVADNFDDLRAFENKASKFLDDNSKIEKEWSTLNNLTTSSILKGATAGVVIGGGVVLATGILTGGATLVAASIVTAWMGGAVGAENGKAKTAESPEVESSKQKIKDIYKTFPQDFADGWKMLHDFTKDNILKEFEDELVCGGFSSEYNDLV